MVPTPVRPVTVAVASPLPVVRHGLTVLLAAHPEVEVVVPQPGPSPVVPDVVLYDVHALSRTPGGDADGLQRLVGSRSVVLAVCHSLRPTLAAQALELGVDGTLDLAAEAEDLAEGVLRAARSGATVHELPTRLGASAGLTPREVDVLTKITQGLSNQEIAETSYLSINSVKTYIRSAYRRIGATTRAQAVVWCVQHGFPSSAEAA